MSSATLDAPTGGLRWLLRPAATVTFFVLMAQLVGFLTRVVVAALFGARVEMDAFLAASTLPQYVMTFFVGALGSVFMPVFVDYLAAQREEEAWRLASAVINLCAIVVGLAALLGAFFAEPLLRWTTPGLSEETLRLAARVAVVAWPTLLLVALGSLLAGVCNARGRFAATAAAPVAGGLANLVAVVALTGWLGVLGLAIGAAASALVQLLLVLRIAREQRWYSRALGWDHPGLRQIVRLLVPLLLSGMLLKATPLVDRYLASGLPEGSIARLDYAFKLVSVAAMLISTGIATVMSATMAWNVSQGDLVGLRRSVSLGLRLMWLAVAPSVVLGAVLAEPLVGTIFQRGEFTARDTTAVAEMLRVYLLALGAMCLGSILGRAFYVMKATRTLAVMGVIEAFAYALYTSWLTRQLGAVGVALGYVLFFNISIAWLAPTLRFRTGNIGGRTVASSFARTSLAAMLGGVAAWLVAATAPVEILRLAAGAVAGSAVYVAGLLLLRSSEVRMIMEAVHARFRR